MLQKVNSISAATSPTGTDSVKLAQDEEQDVLEMTEKQMSTLRDSKPLAQVSARLKHGILGGFISLNRNPEPVPILEMSLQSKTYITSVVTLVTLAIFLLSYFLYTDQSQTVLVSGDELAQCDSYRQVYNFPAEKQSAEIFVQAYDSSSDELKYFNFYAQWSSCDAGYIASEEKSAVFNSSRAEMASFTPWYNVYPYAYYNNPFSAVAMLSTDGESTAYRTGITATYYDLYYGYEQGEGNSSCFQLTCGQGYATSTLPKWYTLVTANCDTSGDNTLGDLVETTAVINSNANGVSATCTATVCGQVLNVYQVSKSVQPSNIYQCTIMNSKENSVSSSFSNSMVAYTFSMQIIIVGAIWAMIGTEGLYHYYRHGGELKVQ